SANACSPKPSASWCSPASRSTKSRTISRSPIRPTSPAFSASRPGRRRTSSARRGEGSRCRGSLRPRFVLARTASRPSSGFPELLEHLAGLAKSVIAHRYAAIDRLLQDDFLDVVGREAALDERGAQVHAELLPPPDRHHGADDQDAARAFVEMRSRPDLAPGAAGDEILPLGVERIPVGIGAIDPGIAQNLAAGVGAASVTLLVAHGLAPRLRSRTPRASSVIGPAFSGHFQLARKNPSTALV